ncbi:TPA_asm: N [Phellodendron betacytorhabdovirus 1]|nr:TPA_asm: N [Phellodendron betacytorhabdovirus 1]
MAAPIEPTLEELLLAEYGKTPLPVLTAIERRDYSDEEFKKSPIYSFDKDCFLSNEQLINAGELLKELLSKTEEDSKIIYLLLIMAINIRRSDNQQENILEPLKWGNVKILSSKAEDINLDSDSTDVESSEIRLTDAELVSAAEKEFVIPNTEGLSKEDADRMVAESRKNHIEAYKTQYAFDFMYRARAAAKKGKSVSESSSSKQTQASFWAFYAAYILKLFVKTPENVILGEQNMRNRYLGFYPGGVAGEGFLSNAALERIKIKMKAHPIVLNTWIGMTATYESNSDSTSQEAGIIRYVANIQFGYNGMHGYGLFREVLIATKWKTGQAIVKMWMDPTAQALNMINSIINKHESVINPDGTTLKRATFFRYARAVDPRFFLDLQPSQCLSLLYICSKILNHFVAQSELANPLKMVALSKLGEKQAKFLDIFVEMILLEGEMNPAGKTQIEKAAIERYNIVKEHEAMAKGGNKQIVDDVRERLNTTRRE